MKNHDKVLSNVLQVKSGLEHMQDMLDSEGGQHSQG